MIIHRSALPSVCDSSKIWYVAADKSASAPCIYRNPDHPGRHHTKQTGPVRARRRAGTGGRVNTTGLPRSEGEHGQCGSSIARRPWMGLLSTRTSAETARFGAVEASGQEQKQRRLLTLACALRSPDPASSSLYCLLLNALLSTAPALLCAVHPRLRSTRQLPGPTKCVRGPLNRPG